MDQLGTDLEFPDNCYLLGDKIYLNRGKFNRFVQRYRIGVERAIAELKTYKSVGSLWRHPRPYLSSVTCICAGINCRKKRTRANFIRFSKASTYI